MTEQESCVCADTAALPVRRTPVRRWLAVVMASDVSLGGPDSRPSQPLPSYPIPFHFHPSLFISLPCYPLLSMLCSALVTSGRVRHLGRYRSSSSGSSISTSSGSGSSSAACGTGRQSTNVWLASSLHESTLMGGAREHTLLKFVCEQPNDVSFEHSENCMVDAGTTTG